MSLKSCLSTGVRESLNKVNRGHHVSFYQVFRIKGTLSRQNNEILLLNVHIISLNVTKYSTKSGLKDSIEQNGNISLEKKCRIARMRVENSSSLLIS